MVNCFLRPEENEIVKFNGKDLVAKSCGIFTFDLYYQGGQFYDDGEYDYELCDDCKESDGYEPSDIDFEDSKLFSQEIRNFIELKLIDNPGLTPNNLYEMICIQFPELGKSRNVCFVQANKIDKDFFNKGGVYWRCAFDNPKESEPIINPEVNGYAKNVGIFTFDIVEK